MNREKVRQFICHPGNNRIQKCNSLSEVSQLLHQHIGYFLHRELLSPPNTCHQKNHLCILAHLSSFHANVLFPTWLFKHYLPHKDTSGTNLLKAWIHRFTL